MTHRTRADLGIIRPSDVSPTPWANGLGVTRVLAARPAWRISLAEIEGRMPFSSFLGADRVLIPLSASGVTLEIDGGAHGVPQHAGFAFRGEDSVVAETGGRRISVVNVMSRRSSGRMIWSIRRVAGAIPDDADATVLLDGHFRRGRSALPAGTVLGPAAVADVLSPAGGMLVQLRLRPHGEL